MIKTIFNNLTFYAIIIALLLILLCWNLYTFFVTNNFIPLIPAAVLAVVLTLVLTRHKHAKLGNKIWSIILIVGPLLSIIGKAVKIFLGNPLNEISPLVLQLIILFIGLAVYHYNGLTVEVKEFDAQEINN